MATLTSNAEAAVHRGHVYATLSRVFLYPWQELFAAVREGDLTAELTAALAGITPAPDEAVAAAARALTEALDQDLAAHPEQSTWEAEYQRLFAHGEVACPPYETEFVTPHVFMQTQQMADIAGFYKAFGIDVDRLDERADHLSAELEFLYLLCMKEAWALDAGRQEDAEVCREAARRFLEDHLGVWIDLFARMLTEKARMAFYPAAAEFCRQFVAAESRRLGAQPQPAAAKSRIGRQGFDDGLFAGAGGKGGNAP